VRALVDGVADVEIRTTVEDPAADRVPLAVGQIVLTATSFPGVDAVRLLRDGRAVPVPVVGGALTAEPVRASDYSALLRRPGATATTGPSRRS
jgi:spore germination protein GerM